MRKILLPLAMVVAAAASLCGCTAFVSAPEPTVTVAWTSEPQLVPIEGTNIRYYDGPDFNLLFYSGRYYWYRDDGWYSSSHWNGGFVRTRSVPRYFVTRIPPSHPYYNRVAVHHPEYSRYHKEAPPPGHGGPQPGRGGQPPGRPDENRGRGQGRGR